MKLHVLESLANLTNDVASSVQMDIAVDEAVRRLDETTPSTPTPWVGLNRAIKGWRPGALYVIGARPSVGKSLFLQQSALGLAAHGRVVFATMEMTAAEVSNRFLSMHTGIPQEKLLGLREDGASPLSPRERAEIDAAAEKLRGLPIRFEETVQTPTDMRERAREIAADGPLAGIFVDYLQLLGTPDNARYRIQELTRYTRELKRMAGEFRCPVIVAAQMNRNATSSGRAPTVSEFRESGSVEQDADVAIILHEEAEKNGVGQGESSGTPLDAYIAKNRQGPKKAVLLRKHGPTVTISDAEDRKDVIRG